MASKGLNFVDLTSSPIKTFNAALNKFHQIVHRKREPECIVGQDDIEKEHIDKGIVILIDR